MKGNDKPINPEMVTIARESRGLTQKELANLLMVSPGWLSRVEVGLRGIQKPYLKKLSEALGYPPSFFTQEQPIYGPTVTDVFHRKRQSLSERTLNKIHAQINIRTMHLSNMIQGLDIGDADIRPIEIYDFNGNPKEIARIIRATWQLPHGPVTNLVDIIENARGIVVPLEFGVREIDAISRWPIGMPPLFFVNIDSPMDRLRFTLAHELGHIIMHQNNIDPNMEYQADQFAAEFLMPEKEIRPYFVELSLDKLAALKPYWKVSMAALLKRAADLNTITPRHARTLWMKMGKAGYRIREPIELDIPKEQPYLLSDILKVYLDDLEYSVHELAKLLHLLDKELSHMYINAQQIQEDRESKAAIKEFERIVKKANHNTKDQNQHI